MKLIIENIELYRYEIHSLVKAFYPEEDVKVVVEEDPHAEKYLKNATGPFMRVGFGEERIEIVAEGRTFMRLASSTGVSFQKKGPACKAALKELLYELLEELCGKKLPWGDLIGIRPTKIPMTMMEEGKTPREAEDFLLKEHRVSPEKAALAVDIAQREAKILEHLHYRDGYSLYVGIPFCPTTCLYCSFPSFALKAYESRVEEYLTALEQEMKETAAIMQGKILDTLYIGGGTPTTLTPPQLDRLIGALRTYFDFGTLQEFTVEAGRPDSITREKLEVLKKHGVTRISVNPQTMKEETLRLIGRRHTAEDTKRAFSLARECGFDNINMDIILGLPEETKEDVARTIEEIKKLGPDSLTVHSLAVKRGSRLQKYIEENGYSSMNNTDECMQIAADGAASMGMKPYYLYRQKNMSGNFENVGYAAEGKYGIYNILIMEEVQTIMALGAGSISKRVFSGDENPGGGVRIERCDNAKDITTYLDNIEEMIGRKKKLFSK